MKEDAMRYASTHSVRKKLSGKFQGRVGVVFIDKCQAARNVNATFSKSIVNLNADFHVLMTATPVP